MAKLEYPLKDVLDIKIKRVEDAEAVVKEKNAILEREKQALVKCEAERDKAKSHKEAKLQQLRDELDHATTSPKIQQMKSYLKIAEEKLKIEEKKVKDQKVKVDAAEKEAIEAKRILDLKRREVDKMQEHKKGWEKEKRREIELGEEKEQDEIGNLTYGMHKKITERM